MMNVLQFFIFIENRLCDRLVLIYAEMKFSLPEVQVRLCLERHEMDVGVRNLHAQDGNPYTLAGNGGLEGNGNLAGERPESLINSRIEIENVVLSDEELAKRREEEKARGDKAFTPPFRVREVSKSLKAYSRMVSSADKGAVRVIE